MARDLRPVIAVRSLHWLMTLLGVCSLAASLTFPANAQPAATPSTDQTPRAAQAPVAALPQSSSGVPHGQTAKPLKLVTQMMVLASPNLGFGFGGDVEIRLWEGLHAGAVGFATIGGSIGFFASGGIGFRTSYRVDVESLVIAPALSIYSFGAGTQGYEYGSVVGEGAAPAGSLQVLNRIGRHFVLGFEVGVIGVGYVVKDGIYVANPTPDEHRFAWCPYGALVLGGNF